MNWQISGAAVVLPHEETCGDFEISAEVRAGTPKQHVLEDVNNARCHSRCLELPRVLPSRFAHSLPPLRIVQEAVKRRR